MTVHIEWLLPRFAVLKMSKTKKKNHIQVGILIFVIVVLVFFFMIHHSKPNDPDPMPEENPPVEEIAPSEETVPEEEEDPVYNIELVDEGITIYSNNGGYGYNYGPSIIRYEDGTYDAWFASPGNSSTQWDWIRYRHSDDGISWSDAEIVLKPTPGTKDRCSVCDPGVIYFNGYYYLAYTSTEDDFREGYNNSAFAARSANPNGPYEKWNGSGWGGDPEPIILFEGDPEQWGIGEVSFVIYNDDLYIYYTNLGDYGCYTGLYKASLTDDWPLTMVFKGIVNKRELHDSLDVVYDEKLDTFFAFAIKYQMSNVSEVTLYESKDGKNFVEMDSKKKGTERYAHSIGVSKSKEGHINSDDELIIGYAYGEEWGKWSTRIQTIKIVEEK